MNRTQEKCMNFNGGNNILIEKGKLSIEEFLNRCNRILPDNYILWCNAFSTELKERINDLLCSKIAFAPANDTVRNLIPLLNKKEEGFPIVFDSNPDTIKSFPVMVKSYNEAHEYSFDKIFIASHRFSDEIEEILLSIGIKRKILSIL